MYEMIKIYTNVCSISRYLSRPGGGGGGGPRFRTMNDINPPTVRGVGGCPGGSCGMWLSEICNFYVKEININCKGISVVKKMFIYNFHIFRFITLFEHKNVNKDIKV